MATLKANVKLCHAVQKQPALYDQSHENYRKRQPSENCWDMVALEVGESVDKCKRRWRQLRTDYARWAAQEIRNGLKRTPIFHLAEELNFLRPHVPHADRSEREWDSAEPEPERESDSKIKETALEASYKAKQMAIDEAVEEQPLADLKRAALAKTQTEIDAKKAIEEEEERKKKEKVVEKVNTKEKIGGSETEDCHSEGDNSSQTGDKDMSEGTATPTASVESATSTSTNSKQPEFFIKPSSSNCLIIGKKRPQPEPIQTIDPLFEQMAEDSPDETASVGGGRRLRRLVNNRIRQKAIQKPVVEQRQTRLQRRKSMTVAMANSLRSSTSPVKMTPLPRPPAAQPKPQPKPQPKTQPQPKPQPKISPKQTPKQAPKQTPVSSRDDIFPRPRSSAPPQPLVLARRPHPLPDQLQTLAYAQAQAQAHVPQQTFPLGQIQPPQQLTQGIAGGYPYGIARARMATSAAAAAAAIGVAPAVLPAGKSVYAARPAYAAPIALRMPVPASGVDVFKVPTAVPATPQSQSTQQQQSQPQQRLVSNSNTLVISTTSCPASGINGSSNANAGSSSSSSLSFSTQTASITASPIVSVSSPMVTMIKRCERANQTDAPDIFSDEHFLDLVRPQMKEMNQRQKMHFKQKIFQGLMETFDDATDFPNSGEVQHFNINTPSGFDHVSNQELRLIRELVSLVSAAKHTAEPAPPAAVPPQAPPNPRGVPTKQQTPIMQRAGRPLQGSTTITATAPGTVIGEDKKLYRIMQMGNNGKLVATGASALAAVSRRESIESNSSSSTIPQSRGSARVGTFLVPGNSAKGTKIQDPLACLLSQSGKVPPTKSPVLLRQMGRRYSVCGGVGGVGPGASNGAGAGAAGAGAPAALAPTPLTTHAERMMLKRRLEAACQAVLPPPQRPRYSQSPVSSGQQAAGQVASNSLLRRAVHLPPKLPSSNGGGTPVPQRTPQIASIQGHVFNDFATPNSVRGSSSASGSSGGNSSISPLKRSLVIANVKSNASAKPSMSAVRSHLGRQQSPAPGANVANLLGETHGPSTSQSAAPSQSQSHSKSPTKSPSDPPSVMAGIIAADDFDMCRLKREPQDIMDDHDDILGL